MSTGNFRESLSKAILAERLLVGRSGVIAVGGCGQDTAKANAKLRVSLLR